VRSRSKGAVMVGAVTMAAASIGVPSSPAAASYPACGTPGSQYDGYNNWSPPPLQESEGASATLTVRFGSVCDSDTSADTYLTVTTNGDTNWEMIAGAGVGEYSQAGYLRWYGSPIYSFAEYHDQFGHYQKLDDFAHPLTQGSSYKYQSQWGPGCHCIQNLAAGVELNQTNFDPTATWHTPWALSYDAEPHYLESDVPGSAAVPAHSANVLRETYGETWTSSLPPMTSTNTNNLRYNQSPLGTCGGNPCFDVWTYYH
jgi:hypothetical protein